MRNPSLHIRKSDLIKLLTGRVPNPEQVAVDLIQEGFKFRIRNRYVVEAKTVRQKEKAVKFVELAEVKINKFNMILTAVRQAAGHRFITTITQKDRDYLMLKEVAINADEFAKLFYPATSYEQAYKKYAQLGVALMGKKYGLNKFKYYKTQIFNLYENTLKINEDTKKEGTEELYLIYIEYVEQARGLRLDFKTDPDKYVNIIYAREQADSLGANYDDWVSAQFEGLSYLNVIPDPNQLNGDNATNRYAAFMMKGQATSPKDSLFELASDVDSNTKDYMEMLKQLQK